MNFLIFIVIYKFEISSREIIIFYLFSCGCMKLRARRGENDVCNVVILYLIIRISLLFFNFMLISIINIFKSQS